MKQQRLPLRVPLGDFARVRALQQGAERYARERGFAFNASGIESVRMDPDATVAVGSAYTQSMGGVTDTPALRQSYRALAAETGEQYDYMTKPKEEGGMGITVEVTPQDPYPSPKELRQDVTQNKRIKVFSTASTGGHSFFTDEENDKFRAVHDVFGHLAIGRNFGRHGEEAAARHHSMMFSPEAHQALYTETRGQNSFVHTYGNFPDQTQHLVSLPDWANQRVAQPPIQPRQHQNYEQGRLF